MRKPRHILRKDWKDSRAEIDQIIEEQQITPDKLRRLSIHEDWKSIEEKIYHEFCQLDDPRARSVWLWTTFKKDTFSWTTDRPFRHLSELVDTREKVWLLVIGDGTKFWFYEGFIEQIANVIGETTYAIDELYVASKKYEWLLCLNHHDVLIATGSPMPDKLRTLAAAIEGQCSIPAL